MKISSLARSSWFHSSSSFSCPFQLSLSCSLVLKAAEEEQPLGEDQAYLSSLLLTLPGQDSGFLMRIFPAGGFWRLRDTFTSKTGHRGAARSTSKPRLAKLCFQAPQSPAPSTQDKFCRIPNGARPASPGLSKMPSQLPDLDLAYTERSHTAAAACPHPFRGAQAPHCGRSLALRRWHCSKETCSRE